MAPPHRCQAQLKFLSEMGKASHNTQKNVLEFAKFFQASQDYESNKESRKRDAASDEADKDVRAARTQATKDRIAMATRPAEYTQKFCTKKFEGKVCGASFDVPTADIVREVSGANDKYRPNTTPSHCRACQAIGKAHREATAVKDKQAARKAAQSKARKKARAKAAAAESDHNSDSEEEEEDAQSKARKEARAKATAAESDHNSDSEEEEEYDEGAALGAEGVPNPAVDAEGTELGAVGGLHLGGEDDPAMDGF